MSSGPLLQEIYSSAVLQQLRRFSAQEADSLAEWLREYRVGSNLALQILEQLEDLAKKTGRGATPLLQEAAASFRGKRLSGKELGRRIRDDFEARLHPFSTAHEEAFHASIQGLALPPEVRIKPPQNFEGEVFTLQLPFATETELAQRLRAVLDSLQTQDWSQLWKF
jgi:hypothetical protein